MTTPSSSLTAPSEELPNDGESLRGGQYPFGVVALDQRSHYDRDRLDHAFLGHLPALDREGHLNELPHVIGVGRGERDPVEDRDELSGVLSARARRHHRVTFLTGLF